MTKFKKAVIIVLPLVFTAQACNFLFGDLYGNQGSGNRGVFISNDSGDSWQESNKLNPKGSLAGAQISKFTIEAANTKNILAASLNAGIYASDSKGKAWILLLSSFAAYDVAFNPDNGQEIFAAGSQNGSGSILKSSDHGSTWVQTYRHPTNQTAVVALAFDQLDKKLLYAGLSTGTVLKSTDSGMTWTSLSDLKDRIMNLAVANDPGHTIYILLKAQGLQKSTNSGQSWSQVKVTPKDSAVFNQLLVDPTNPSRLYVASDAGLFRSQDAGATFSKISLPVTTSDTNVTAVAVNSQNNRQIFTAIRSIVYRSDDQGSSWKTVALSTNRTVTSFAVDSSEPNQVYAGLK